MSKTLPCLIAVLCGLLAMTAACDRPGRDPEVSSSASSASSTSASSSESPDSASNGSQQASPSKSTKVASTAKKTAQPKETPPVEPAPVEPASVDEGPRLRPRDESARDATLVRFLANFKQVVRKRDTAALIGLLAPDVKNAFGGADGEVSFRRVWSVDHPNSPVWQVLQPIISVGGGAWQGDPKSAEAQYFMPYPVVTFPSELPAENHLVILDSGVRMRAMPESKAKTVATLNYDIVEALPRGQNEDPQWRRVRTATGVEGYVQTAYVYSATGFKIGFAKDESGSWRISALIAGS